MSLASIVILRNCFKEMYMNNLFSVGLVIKVMFLSCLLIFALLYFSVYKLSNFCIGLVLEPDVVYWLVC